MNKLQNKYLETLNWIRQYPRLVAADDYEIGIESTHTKREQHENGKRCFSNDGIENILRIRLLHRMNMGFSSTSDLSRDAVHRTIELAFQNARASDTDLYAKFPIWKNQLKASTKPPGVTSRADDLFSSSYEKVKGRVLDFSEQIESKTTRTLLTRKNEKLQQEDTYSLESVKLMGLLRHPMAASTAQISIEMSTSSIEITEAKKKLIEEFIERSEKIGKAALLKFRPELTNYPVLFAPKVACKILEAFIECHLKNLTKTHQDLPSHPAHRRMFEAGFSIVDDGTMERGLYSFRFDSEGCLRQKTILFDDGFFRTWLSDTRSGLKINRPSTGNAHWNTSTRGFLIKPTSLFIKSNRALETNLLSKIENGMWIDEAKIQTINSEEVSLKGMGWVIDGFAVKYFVPEINLTLNPRFVLQQITHFGNDLKFFENYGAPSLYFEKFPIQQAVTEYQRPTAILDAS